MLWVLVLAGCAAPLRPASSPAQRAVALASEVHAAGLALTELRWLPAETRARAITEVGRHGTPRERLQRLARWLSAEHGLGFTYAERVTLTASEAWRTRRGDCLSYAHLVAALAPELGVEVGYVQYRAPREVVADGGKLTVITHVANLHEEDRESVLVELANQAFSVRMSDYRRLAEDEVLALHVSNLAMLELEGGEPGLAERLLSAALAVAPQLAELHVNLGAARLRARRPAEALRGLEDALRRFPHEVGLYVNAAQAAAALGQFERARALTAKAEAPWTDPFLAFVRATELLERGDAAGALTLLERVAMLQPGSATTQLHLARALAALGRRSEARAALTRAHRLDPKHPGVAPLARQLFP